MKLRSASFALMLVSLAVFAAPRGTASQIVNGGFESPPILPGSFLDISPGQEAGDGFLGWTVTTGNVDVVNPTQPLFGINWGAQASIDGSQILDLNGFTSGGIAQSFATVAGVQYSVQAWFANNPLGSGGTALLDVADVGTTNNTLLSSPIVHNTSTLTLPDWQLYSASFVAQGPLSSFSLLSTSGVGDPSGGVVVDAISVAPVPEPSSFALALLALASTMMLRRRGKAVG